MPAPAGPFGRRPGLSGQRSSPQDRRPPSVRCPTRPPRHPHIHSRPRRPAASGPRSAARGRRLREEHEDLPRRAANTHIQRRAVCGWRPAREHNPSVLRGEPCHDLRSAVRGAGIHQNQLKALVPAALDRADAACQELAGVVRRDDDGYGRPLLPERRCVGAPSAGGPYFKPGRQRQDYCPGHRRSQHGQSQEDQNESQCRACRYRRLSPGHPRELPGTAGRMPGWTPGA